MERLRTGVIGLGRMGQHHCRVYASQKESQLAGVYDINPQLAGDFSARYEVPAYASLDDLLEHVDAVTIATPTPTHFELAMRCLEKGVHVLLEKPVTESIEDARQLEQAVEAKDMVVQVGHIERFNPTYMELKKVLEDLEVIAVSFRRLSPFKGSNTDVDVVLDLMVHDLDLSNDLMGRAPSLVNAYGLMPFSHKPDHVVAQLLYSNGPLITLTASRVTENKIRAVDVTSEDAFVEADFLNKSISIHRRSTGEYTAHNRNGGVKYRQESVIERILVPNVEPLSLEIKHFLDCVTQKCTPCVSVVDGMQALELARRISQMVCAQDLQAAGQMAFSS